MSIANDDDHEDAFGKCEEIVQPPLHQTRMEEGSLHQLLETQEDFMCGDDWANEWE